MRSIGQLSFVNSSFTCGAELFLRWEKVSFKIKTLAFTDCNIEVTMNLQLIIHLSSSKFGEGNISFWLMA